MAAFQQLSLGSFAGLPVTRYEITLRATAAAQLPAFPGSALRGAFGHALKRAVCVMPHGDCARCLVATRCIYPYVFETPWPAALAERHRAQQNAPHPYLLDPPVYRVLRTASAAAPVNAALATQAHHAALPQHHSAPAQDGERAETLCHSDAVATLAAAEMNPAEPSNAAAPPRPGKWAREVTLAADDTLVFGLTLLGRAHEHLPFLIYAVHEMAEQGLSVRRHRFELTQVARLAPDGARAVIYTGATQQLASDSAPPAQLTDWIAARLAEFAPAAGASLRLRFTTPLRIVKRDDLQTRLSFELLARNLSRRVTLLLAAHGTGAPELDYHGLLARAAQVETVSSRLRWWDWGRWSNRQQTRMKLGGLVGEVEFGGEALAEFLPLLAAGEVLRVGSGTSFGLGRYELVGGER